MELSQGWQDPDALDREAAEWVALVATDPVPDNVAAARQWCQQSAGHRAAFERARWLWAAADRLQSPPHAMPRAEPWRTHARWAIAATLVITLAALGWLIDFPHGDYHNGTGAPRSLALADGSKMFLDAKSAVDVDFTADTRDLTLLEGRALFEVAHDARRPFIVRGVNLTARALGTIYEVERAKEGTAVTVARGAVQVAVPGYPPVELRAGDSIRYDRHTGMGPRRAVNLDDELAWRRGRLVFDRTPLREAVASISRYRPGYVLIVDSELARRPVSGSFNVERTDEALAMMEQALHFNVHRITDYLVILSEPERPN
ncbi:MAG: FecR domain-containing protein [Gammaproteobacteria bacterium]